jgi:hypothetical protein
MTLHQAGCHDPEPGGIRGCAPRATPAASQTRVQRRSILVKHLVSARIVTESLASRPGFAPSGRLGARASPAPSPRSAARGGRGSRNGARFPRWHSSPDLDVRSGARTRRGATSATRVRRTSCEAALCPSASSPQSRCRAIRRPSAGRERRRCLAWLRRFADVASSAMPRYDRGEDVPGPGGFRPQPGGGDPFGRVDVLDTGAGAAEQGEGVAVHPPFRPGSGATPQQQ